jgi:hypothetical protein
VAEESRVVRVDAALTLVMLALYYVYRLPLTCDPDVYHTLSVGREVILHRGIPLVDRFAYTPTRVPIVHHEWLTGTALYLVVSVAGSIGFTVVKYVFAFGTAATALLLARRQGAGLAVLCVLGPLGLNLIAPGMTNIRAQVITLLFTAITLHLLESDRRGERWWIAVYLPLHILWLNCHAGFVVGMGLIVLHAMEQASNGRPWRHLLPVLAVATMAILINPAGFAYLRYLSEGLLLDRPLISEWQPLWTVGFSTMALWTVSVIVEVYGLIKVGRQRAAGWMLVLGAAYGALRHQRHLPIYGVVWLAQVPPLIEQARLGTILERMWRGWPVRTALLLTAFSVWLLVRLAAAQPWRLRLPATPGEDLGIFYPIGVAAYLDDARFHGNVMVPFELGAFLSWKLERRVKVSIDGRYEVAYDPALLSEHVRFYQGDPVANDLPDRYPTDAILVPRGWPVAPTLAASGRWRLVYQDDGFDLFASPTAALSPVDRRGAPLAGPCP